MDMDIALRAEMRALKLAIEDGRALNRAEVEDLRQRVIEHGRESEADKAACKAFNEYLTVAWGTLKWRDARAVLEAEFAATPWGDAA